MPHTSISEWIVRPKAADIMLVFSSNFPQTALHMLKGNLGARASGNKPKHEENRGFVKMGTPKRKA